MIAYRLPIVVIVVAVHLQCSLAFAPPTFLASNAASSALDKNNDDGPRLPPGRRTPKFINFLFDDSIKLLNPDTMASYQVKRTEQYGEIFKTNIFLTPTVFCTSEATVRQLAQQEPGRTEACFPPHHQKLFGEKSLLVQSGPTHDQLRRLIQPSLSPTAIKSYVPMIEASIKSFLEELRDEIPPEPFALVPKFRSFFVRIAVRILFGDSILKLREEEELAEDLSIWGKGLVSAPLTFIPWSTAAKAMRARKRVAQKLNKWIEDERQSPSPASTSLLSKLISTQDVDGDGSSLSNDDIIDNVLTLIFAGSDTTASAATSMIMVLLQNPSLKQELSKKPELCSSLSQAILQSYPPAPFFMRMVKKDIQVDDYTIPAGWMVVYGIAGAMLQLQKVDWSSIDEIEKINADLAFGAGPRKCPGRFLAMLELETLCRLLVSMDTYPELELVGDQKLEQTYTPGFFPLDGLQVVYKATAEAEAESMI